MTNTTTTTIQTATTTEFAKMVKAEKLRFIASLVEVSENENVNEVIEFLEAEAVRVETKNAKRTTKKSATQVENDKIRERVMELFEGLEDKETVLVATQIFEELELADFSSQKQTALLKPLADEGKLEKVPNVQVVTTDANGNEKKSRKMGYKLA